MKKLRKDWRQTTGCTKYLKYKDFLLKTFFICIDSELRYLQKEELLAEKVYCKIRLIHSKIIVLLLQSSSVHFFIFSCISYYLY